MSPRHVAAIVCSRKSNLIIETETDLKAVAENICTKSVDKRQNNRCTHKL